MSIADSIFTLVRRCCSLLLERVALFRRPARTAVASSVPLAEADDDATATTVSQPPQPKKDLGPFSEEDARNLILLVAAKAREAESRWLAGDLAAWLNSQPEAELPLKYLLDCYARLLKASVPRPCPLRAVNFPLMVEAFEALAEPPRKIFAAAVDSSKYLLVSREGLSDCRMRFDQAYSAWRWGNGFAIANSVEEAKTFRLFIEMHVHRFASDLSSLEKVQRRFRNPRPEKPLLPEPTGSAFERLIIDILNEEEYSAREASLIEDVFEKTDIRVRYRDVARSRGTRAQVTLTANELHYEKKREKILLQDELVIISPLTLARFFFQDDFEKLAFPRAEIWIALCKVCDSPADLGAVLKNIFFNALQRRNDNPYGPFPFVPEAVRRLVRVYTHIGARAAVTSLRTREGKGISRRSEIRRQQAYRANKTN